ncbi:hypothetical protein H6F74_06450 [Trichocoleus sp. FACHB-90]|nr:hypothetical protein [Trichocoleus sp. FACHB-90]
MRRSFLTPLFPSKLRDRFYLTHNITGQLPTTDLFARRLTNTVGACI